ncbi:MAG: H-X9-DG-CTERM domain-containing protein [Planctomycetota bacterium]|jgi:prepilin-type processing-associated H-X9-DG protein
MRNPSQPYLATLARPFLAGLIAMTFSGPAWAGEPAAAEQAEKNNSDEAIKRIMNYAPPDAVGAVHVDVAAIRKDFAAAFEKNEKAAKAFKAEAILAIAKKVDVLDIYFLKSAHEPKSIFILHGTAGPKDIADLVEKVTEEKVNLSRQANGRYKLDDYLSLLAADEADDVKGKFLLIAIGVALTDEFVSSLGKHENEMLTRLLEKVDTSAQAWGAATFKDSVEEDAPNLIAGHMNLRGDVVMKVEIYMFSDDWAAKVSNEIAEVFPGLIEAKQEKEKISLTIPGLKDAAAKIIDSMLRAYIRGTRQHAGSRLRHIAWAVRTYITENKQSPPSLLKLVEEGRMTADALLSPSSGREEIKTDESGTPTEPGDLEYIVLPTEAPGDLVRAYEKPEINDNEGANVLFADGSVKWLDMADFEKALKRTEDWLAKRDR